MQHAGVRRAVPGAPPHAVLRLSRGPDDPGLHPASHVTRRRSRHPLPGAPGLTPPGRGSHIDPLPAAGSVGCVHSRAPVVAVAPDHGPARADPDLVVHLRQPLPNRPWERRGLAVPSQRRRETEAGFSPSGLKPTCPPRTVYRSRMHRMSLSADFVTRRIGLVLCLLVSLAPMRVSAQERVDTAEFAARRARLLAGIPDGIAVILGGEEHIYKERFRQSPDLYYLTGLEEPGVILVLNGVTKNAAVFALKRPKFG